MTDVIYSINGPVVKVQKTKSFTMAEMVYVGDKRLVGEVIGVNRFGESAPAGELFKYFGITTEAVVAAVKKLVA